jgi:uncharacterized membrane protein
MSSLARISHYRNIFENLKNELMFKLRKLQPFRSAIIHQLSKENSNQTKVGRLRSSKQLQTTRFLK